MMTDFHNNDSSLASELHNWAVNTMQLTPNGIGNSTQLPSVDDFRLICRGQMSDVWRYVISRVHSCQTVRNVKGNLALKRLQETRSDTLRCKANGSSNANAALYEQCNGVMSDVKSMISSSQQLERDIDSLQQQIFATENAYKGATNQLNDATHKKLLLDSHSKCVADELERIDELTKRVRHKHENLLNAQRKSPVMLSKNESSADNDAGAGGLETACYRAVRNACELVAVFLHNLLHGGFEQNKSSMSRSKDELWNAVNLVLSSFKASEILSSLCVYTDNTIVILRHKTMAIDIRKDAENLRFKYESGGRLSDVSARPSVLHSVHQLLEVSQATVFARFIETEKYHNETIKMQRRLSEASQILDEFLCRQFGNCEKLQISRNILETETRLMSAKAVVKALEDVSVDLEHRIIQATADKEILYAKFQKIQDFKKLTDMKQNLIRVLVKQNMNSRARLVNQQSENLAYAEKSLASHETEIQQLTSSLKESLSLETDAFIRLDLSLLPSITMNGEQKTCICDLSIYKLGLTSHVACSQLLTKLLQKLNMPYVASEYLLLRITEQKMEANSTNLALKLIPDADRQSVQQIRELCHEVSKHDRQAIDQLLPVLQKRLTEATQTLSDCLEVKDIAKDWWDQPGQFCTPWITVDGLTLKQWRDKWTVSATRLRQLPMKSSG